MQQRGIVHPAMLERLRPGFYPDVCSIHARLETQDAYGQPDGRPSPLPVADLTGIACRVSPLLAGSREVRRDEAAWMESKFNIALNGYYPQIDGTQYVKVGATFYAIEPPPQHDGNGKTTRLLCRIVE